MLSFRTNANSLKYEALHLEHVERVVLFDGHLVFSDVIKELLKEWIVRVFNQVLKVLFHHIKESSITLINSTIIDEGLGCFNHLPSVFQRFGAVLPGLAPLILGCYVSVDLLLVNVVHAHRRAIIPLYLRLKAKLAVAHGADKVLAALP